MFQISEILLTLLIAVTSIIGDKLVENGKTLLFRALSDNLTHGFVSGISWTLIVILLRQSVVTNIGQILFCIFLSSFIDLDHFIEARSWKLIDVVHLEKRGFLHCTTIPIVLWMMLLLSSNVFKNGKLEVYSWMILISFLSHHVRDATRRGLWLAPFGSTRTIPYPIYIIIDMMLPYAVYALINKNTRQYVTSHGVINIV